MERRTENGEGVDDWVEALQQGQETEVNSRKLFGHYYGWVRGFFERRLRPRGNLERAEELAQETFFQAFQRIQSFRREGSFDSWLFAIAANQLRNDKRRLSQQKRSAEEVSLTADGAENPLEGRASVDSQSPERVAAGKQRLQAALSAIERLPDRQKSCVRLLLAGYDYGRIGELLKMAPSTARAHVHAARQRLQEELSDVDKWF